MDLNSPNFTFSQQSVENVSRIFEKRNLKWLTIVYIPNNT